MKDEDIDQRHAAANTWCWPCIERRDCVMP